MAERGISRWEQMKRVDVLDFLGWLDNRQWADSSKLKLLRSLRAFFSWAEKDEDCEAEQLKSFRRVLPAIEQTKPPTVLPSLKEIKRFLGSLDTKTRAGHRDYVALTLMLDTGMRSGELRFLQLHHLFFEESRILVPREGKTGQRMVPVSRPAIRVLRGWLRRREQFAKCEYVFVNHHGQQIGRYTLDHAFRKQWQKVNVSRVTPHLIRHLFCTLYLRNGGNLAKLKSITGHSSYQMLDHYLHLAEIGSEAMREEQERVTPLKSVSNA
jgi:integrase/recombinase XerD